MKSNEDINDPFTLIIIVIENCWILFQKWEAKINSTILSPKKILFAIQRGLI